MVNSWIYCAEYSLNIQCMYREKELSCHSHKLAMLDNRHAIFHKSLQACVTETAHRDEVHLFLHAYGLSEAVHSKGSKILLIRTCVSRRRDQFCCQIYVSDHLS